ncbi:Gamma-secretase-activating protein [Collichthys lucidus]|uniref:Gamma-secretase-activating protein n=1 Tax=Collichthys lucidus TaxID=240159 RepID=A0A4U5VSE7_COLLU|nr:Gamma-secretase-activating protein [Collichthys lucidus]
MLLLNPKFDLHRDVACDLLRKEASVCRVQEYSGAVDTRILNIERDGGILFSWKGATGTTRIGKYDPNTKQNKLLYTFDKQVCVSSCSLNKEETLLVSKCLTLLIEIHPISNTKVLKAVDCRVKVQFLNSETDRRSVLESHLLLLTEDGYVDLYHVLLTRQEGYRVVMANPERLSRTVERIVEDFCWVQWDGHTQRLYCLTHNDKFLMRCVQFYLNHNCETVMELPLELPANPFRTVKFVNLGFDHYHMERPEQELVKMEVLTNRTGSMFVCYSQPLRDNQNLIYTVVSVHKDCSKTFRASLGSEQSPQQKATQLHPLFIPIGPDLHLDPQCQSANLTVLHAEEESSASLLDLASGRIYTPALSPAYLLQMLQSDTPSRCSSKTDPQCLAALHCLLVYMGNDPTLELKIIEWLCDNVKAFESFDQIQEFILEVREETIQPHESHGGEHKEVGLPPTGDKKLVPLFQEEDHQQRALIGLLELIRHMLESVWLKYKLGPHVLSLKQRGSPAEWSVFHFMFRILEATKGLCLPLPPGYHTLLVVFAVRCLPHHTFLQYIDQGILQLTETFVSRLMTALDPFEEQENVDARFVEETALKQTLVLLGFEEK